MGVGIAVLFRASGNHSGIILRRGGGTGLLSNFEKSATTIFSSVQHRRLIHSTIVHHHDQPPPRCLGQQWVCGCPLSLLEGRLSGRTKADLQGVYLRDWMAYGMLLHDALSRTIQIL